MRGLLFEKYAGGAHMLVAEEGSVTDRFGKLAEEAYKQWHRMPDRVEITVSEHQELYDSEQCKMQSVYTIELLSDRTPRPPKFTRPGYSICVYLTAWGRLRVYAYP